MPKGSSSKNKNKPLTAFFQFRKDIYDEVKDDNPGAKITKLTVIIAERWRELNQDERDDYDKRYQDDKQRYEEEKRKYEKKYGEIPVKIKKSKKAK